MYDDISHANNSENVFFFHIKKIINTINKNSFPNFFLKKANTINKKF